jgi:hypothetical protein
VVRFTVRLFATFALGIFTFVLALSSPASAAPQKINERIDIPAFPFFDNCTGELFIASGTIHFVFKTTSAEVTKFEVHINARSTGIGVVTQARYTFIETENAHGRIGTPFPLTIHSVSVVRVIGQGATADFHFHLVAAIAFDANGNLTMNNVRQNTTCGAEPVA